MRAADPGVLSAVVLAGGEPVDPTAVPPLPADALVIAADSGLHVAAELALHVDVVVGDLDSAAPDAVAVARQAGARVERHPVDKDRTDLDLALAAASAAGAHRVVVVGGGGGRLDHLLGNVLLLGSDDYAHLELEALVSGARLLVVRRERELHGEPGSLVSLLPLGGPARGVRTTGLRFPLDGDDLAAGSSRGVSNELVAPVATVALDAGVALAVQPDAGGR